jgi:hypothetical protein
MTNTKHQANILYDEQNNFPENSILRKSDTSITKTIKILNSPENIEEIVKFFENYPTHGTDEDKQNYIAVNLNIFMNMKVGNLDEHLEKYLEDNGYNTILHDIFIKIFIPYKSIIYTKISNLDQLIGGSLKKKTLKLFKNKKGDSKNKKSSKKSKKTSKSKKLSKPKKTSKSKKSKTSKSKTSKSKK